MKLRWVEKAFIVRENTDKNVLTPREGKRSLGKQKGGINLT